MDSKLLLEEYLLLLKSTTEVYVHGTLESSTDKIRNLLQNSLTNTLNCQNRCYKELVKNGWYKVSNVEQNKINQTLTKLENSN